MPDLILHVGPGKCGSTSIQNFFRTHKRPCVEKTCFEVLDPSEIAMLNHETPDMTRVDAFTNRLKKSLDNCDVLILSHEYLFDCPDAILRICNLARNLTSRISISGYSRRQSDFVKSVYSQWLFRLPDRVKETTDILTARGLNPVVFSGLERQMIASIVDDFHSARQPSGKNILDWFKSYRLLSERVETSGAKVVCGILPQKSSANSLIQDFCEKVGLTLKKRMKTRSRRIENVRFNDHLVEAMNNAVALGLEVPGPNENNREIKAVSENMSLAKKKESHFLSSLQAYVDAYFWPSNERLCAAYGLDKNYFMPSEQLGKKEIMAIVREEDRKRNEDSTQVINKNRLLSAHLAITCLNLPNERPFARRSLDSITNWKLIRKLVGPKR